MILALSFIMFPKIWFFLHDDIKIVWSCNLFTVLSVNTELEHRLIIMIITSLYR